MATPEGWSERPLMDLIVSIEGGVSVNSEGRMVREGESGVLMTSAVTYGRFDPTAHKTVMPSEVGRVRKAVRGGTVLFSRMNTPALVGASVYVPSDYPSLFLPDRLWELRTREDVDARWLSHQLGSERTRGAIAGLASGTSASMKNISKEKLLGLRLLTPTRDEQRKIAAILSSVDQTIEKTEAVISQLQVVKKAMMQELLTRGMPGRHTRFKQTEIGEIPEGWEVVRLGAIAPLQTGYPFKSSEFSPVGDRLVRGSNVGVGELRWGDSITVRLPSERRSQFAPYSLVEGDVLIAMDRPFIDAGFKIAIVTHQDLPSLLLQRVGRFCPVDVHNSFLWCLLQSELVQGRLRILQKGTDLPHVSKEEIESCVVVAPSPGEQAEVGMVVDALDQRLKAEKCAVGRLHEAKASLSASLLSGDVRVSPDEDAVPSGHGV